MKNGFLLVCWIACIHMYKLLLVGEEVWPDGTQPMFSPRVKLCFFNTRRGVAI